MGNGHENIDELIAMNDSEGGDYYELGSMKEVAKNPFPMAMGASPLFEIMTKMGEPRYITQAFSGLPTEERYGWAQDMARMRLEKDISDTLTTMQAQKLLNTSREASNVPSITERLSGFVKDLFSK
jgi:hypothetical protein